MKLEDYPNCVRCHKDWRTAKDQIYECLDCNICYFLDEVEIYWDLPDSWNDLFPPAEDITIRWNTANQTTFIYSNNDYSLRRNKPYPPPKEWQYQLDFLLPFDITKEGLRTYLKFI